MKKQKHHKFPYSYRGDVQKKFVNFATTVEGPTTQEFKENIENFDNNDGVHKTSVPGLFQVLIEFLNLFCQAVGSQSV